MNCAPYSTLLNSYVEIPTPSIKLVYGDVDFERQLGLDEAMRLRPL
jgi:hypothetical protein